MHSLRLTSVIPTFGAGGIGPVCRYTAAAIAQATDWRVALVSLHDPPGTTVDPETGLTITSLGLDVDTASGFATWLNRHPQDVLITSNVSGIEPAYPYLPRNTVHIEQIHDSASRYRSIATRNAKWLDGVTCVGRHFEPKLRQEMAATGSKALLRAIHNGAAFPPALPRREDPARLRLLFVGRTEPQKGAFDMPALLAKLIAMGVPAHLTIAGGNDSRLRNAFLQKGVAEQVTWAGRVPHSECYRLASESDVMLVLSRKEAFGMVTIEGMCMGCVPVAYNIHSGSPEIIEHDTSGLLVKPGSIARLAQAISALHVDRQRLQRLSTGAMARARTAFAIDVTANNMATFVRDVIEHARTHPSQRLNGEPPVVGHSAVSPPRRGYQRLPEDWRLAVHRWLCSFPRLANYIYNR